MDCMESCVGDGNPSATRISQEIWYGFRTVECIKLTGISAGPVIRISPNMLLVNDSTKLPEIYNRAADKSKYYLLGVTDMVESVFQIREHKVHAYYRKIIASSVCHRIHDQSEADVL